MHVPDFRMIRSPFGDGWRVECPDCTYKSPVVSWLRASAVADEHRRKTSGVWRPAK